MESSCGDGAGAFLFEVLSHQAGIAERPDQMDDALVLFDFTDEESDVGDEVPDDVGEYDGLSGRVEDSEIQ